MKKLVRYLMNVLEVNNRKICPLFEEGDVPIDKIRGV